MKSVRLVAVVKKIHHIYTHIILVCVCVRCRGGRRAAAATVDQRNAGELSSVCTAQKGTTELSEWIEMRQAGQGMGRIPARRQCAHVVRSAERAAVIVIIAIAIRIQPRSPLRTKV